jgi:hypothetical protein
MGFLLAQAEEQTIKGIYKSALTNAKCYSSFEPSIQSNCSRLSGSANADKALYTKSQLKPL